MGSKVMFETMEDRLRYRLGDLILQLTAAEQEIQRLRSELTESQSARDGEEGNDHE